MARNPERSARQRKDWQRTRCGEGRLEMRRIFVRRRGGIRRRSWVIGILLAGAAALPASHLRCTAYKLAPVRAVNADTLTITGLPVRLFGVIAPQWKHTCKRADDSRYDCGQRANRRPRYYRVDERLEKAARRGLQSESLEKPVRRCRNHRPMSSAYLRNEATRGEVGPCQRPRILTKSKSSEEHSAVLTMPSENVAMDATELVKALATRVRSEAGRRANQNALARLKWRTGSG